MVFGYLFQPVHCFAVEGFLDGDVGHGGSGRSAVPVFLARREADDVAGVNFFNRPAFALSPTGADSDYKGLAERMRVPCGASAWLESDAGSGGARGRTRDRSERYQ